MQRYANQYFDFAQKEAKIAAMKQKITKLKKELKEKPRALLTEEERPLRSSRSSSVKIPKGRRNSRKSVSRTELNVTDRSRSVELANPNHELAVLEAKVYTLEQCKRLTCLT